jgi:hypothetical protein
MSDLFKIIELHNKKEIDKKEISIGIEVRIAEQQVSCSISRACKSYEELVVEVERIQDNLNRILELGKRVFTGSLHGEKRKITSEMSPQELWSILSEIGEEELLIESFNDLDEDKRREVAEYVFSRCNVFSGKASVFSSRYDTVSGLMK